ncbi:MAG: sigma factor [Fimbriimonas sp.]|nr:sigma factor [Fimbriimonas sp.]
MIPCPPSEQAIVVIVDAIQMKIDAAKDHSQDGFFREHGQADFAYAVRRIGDPSAAEDITSEVFLEAIRNSKRRYRADPLPWLYGIARRKVANYLRIGARHKIEPLSDLMQTGMQNPYGALEAAEGALEFRRVSPSRAPLLALIQFPIIHTGGIQALEVDLQTGDE